MKYGSVKMEARLEKVLSHLGYESHSAAEMRRENKNRKAMVEDEERDAIKEEERMEAWVLTS